ncbi:MAG: hypothetical protein KBB55_02670 [Candidatus Buchananbacteria bacterium]|nr:hypothetical protein [Candidatus Buchananbacteria bacterium]
MTLQDLVAHFYGVFGRRNDIFLPDLRTRIDLLNFGVADLRDGIRKHPKEQRVMEVALARIFSRICCINHSLPTIELGRYLSIKFGQGCGYCGQAPCVCDPNRPREVLYGEVDTNTSEWSLSQWCQHLDALYGDNNRVAGVYNALSRLVDEYAEFQRLYVGIPAWTGTQGQLESELGLELADTLAWVIAVANVLGVDLEQVVWQHYGAGCKNCQAISCLCPRHNLQQIDWNAWLQDGGKSGVSSFVKAE